MRIVIQNLCNVTQLLCLQLFQGELLPAFTFLFANIHIFMYYIIMTLALYNGTYSPCLQYLVDKLKLYV